MPRKWVTAGIAHKRSPNLEPRVVQYLKRNGQVVEHSGSPEAPPGGPTPLDALLCSAEGCTAEAERGKGVNGQVACRVVDFVGIDMCAAACGGGEGEEGLGQVALGPFPMEPVGLLLWRGGRRPPQVPPRSSPPRSLELVHSHAAPCAPRGTRPRGEEGWRGGSWGWWSSGGRGQRVWWLFGGWGGVRRSCQ